MAKKDLTLLEKAKGHRVFKQSKRSETDDELSVYIAYINGELETTQAVYALPNCNSEATFRSRVGAVIRSAIIAGRVDEIGISTSEE